MNRLFLSIAFAITLFSGYCAVPLAPLDQSRIDKIASLLSNENTGYGVPCENREVWDRLAKQSNLKQYIGRAQELIEKPFPAWSDSLYLIFSKTGMRPDGEKMMVARRTWLPVLVWAECLENRGRFVPTIELVLSELCKQPTWVAPAHDWHLENFKQTNPNVDLSSATQANEIGQALYMLGDKLNGDVRKMVVDRLFEKVFNPVLKTARELDKRHYWFTVQNNWNSVCLAGVTASALAVIEDVKLRAEFVAIAEKYAKNGIEGYLADGYCTEGLGYYNYGFGNYLLLREAVWCASNGQIELFNEPKIVNIATYGLRTEINNRVYPAIADCRVGELPNEWVLWYCGRNLGIDMIDIKREDIPLQNNLLTDLMVAFSNSVCNTPPKGDLQDLTLGKRSYFKSAGLLLCRPDKKDSKEGIAVAIKGGTNGESHNHNDVGSYSIVVGNEMIAGDPGGPFAYTNKTFTNVRYSLYKSFASYGHPLPVVDGIEQYESRNAKAVVIDTIFTDKQDIISYDLCSAYKAPFLVKLTRTFKYLRSKHSVFEVSDSFKSEKPIIFETAITTRAKVEIKGEKIYLVGDKYALQIDVKSSAPVKIEQAEIADYGMVPFTRIGISIDKQSQGEITLIYR